MKETMLDTIHSCLGTPACAVPLSCCHMLRPYLLEQAEISQNGTAILFTVPYVMTADAGDPHRNLSLYAVPRDYHGYMHELSCTVIPILQNAYPQNRFALFSDHSPIAEVNAAARAGLGVLGQNGLLLTPTYGSFVFIAEICTDADYTTVTGQTIPSFPDEPPLCEGCGACQRACPSKEGLCLSALTQKKGPLTPEETASLRSHSLVWGCDDCQLACPHNQRILMAKTDTTIPYFREKRILYLDTGTLDAMNDNTFTARAYAWRGRPVIRRNLTEKEEPV